jgi:hypothetical protein
MTQMVMATGKAQLVDLLYEVVASQTGQYTVFRQGSEVGVRKKLGPWHACPKFVPTVNCSLLRPTLRSASIHSSTPSSVFGPSDINHHAPAQPSSQLSGLPSTVSLACRIVLAADPIHSFAAPAATTGADSIYARGAMVL